MTALDTNVIVRFLVRDDEQQSETVYKYLKKAEKSGEAFFIPLAVVLETVWVLGSAYRKSRADILNSLESLMHSQVFRLDRDDVVGRVISDARNSDADIADLIIAHSARASGCKSGLTFDKKAAKHPFFKLLH